MRTRDEHARGHGQHDEQVGVSHHHRRAHREAGIREKPLVAHPLDEAHEQQGQEELARAVLPEPLTAHAPCARAEGVDPGDAQRPSQADQFAERPEEQDHRQGRDGRGRQFFEPGGP